MLPAKMPDALSDAERATCQAELATHVGAEAAAAFSWLRRLALALDGSTLIETKRPILARTELEKENPAYGSAPWAYPDRHPAAQLMPGEGGRPGMQSETVYLPVAEAVELLAGDANPERELARRFDCLERAVEAHNLEAQKRIDEIHQRREA
ncbi:MAG TPA: hypothetical protein VHK47_11420, partial [Polyangia bacterium]|nr:hypothetical protein [Polyangia bacterium]